jgi:hypothetical protein
VSLGAAGVFLLRARRTYPTDVATAGAGWTSRSSAAPAERPASPAPSSDPPEAQ